MLYALRMFSKLSLTTKYLTNELSFASPNYQALRPGYEKQGEHAMNLKFGSC